MDIGLRGEKGGIGSSNKNMVWNRSQTVLCILYSPVQIRVDVARLSVLKELCITIYNSQNTLVPCAGLRECAIGDCKMEDNIHIGY